MPDASSTVIASFIERWEKSGGSEKANYALFFTELCDEILHVPHPEPAGPDNARNLYVFERAVTHKEADGSTSTGFIDLYKSACLLAETKQGTFAKAAKDGTLLDFIPNQTTRKTGHGKRGTASFDKVLQRCLFTMFAEDVELLPKNSFLGLLEKLKDSPAGFPVMLQTLWKDMAKGSDFSTVLFGAIPHFNGGLFEDTTALPLQPEQMALLIHAAKSDWAAVEPVVRELIAALGGNAGMEDRPRFVTLGQAA